MPPALAARVVVPAASTLALFYATLAAAVAANAVIGAVLILLTRRLRSRVAAAALNAGT